VLHISFLLSSTLVYWPLASQVCSSLHLFPLFSDAKLWLLNNSMYWNMLSRHTYVIISFLLLQLLCSVYQFQKFYKTKTYSVLTSTFSNRGPLAFLMYHFYRMWYPFHQLTDYNDQSIWFVGVNSFRFSIIV